MTRKQVYNTKHFKQTRRDLRKDSTVEEKILWEKIRNSKLGVKFKRQESIGNFIVDFYCPSKKLVIEIDGVQHKDNVDYDRERTGCLNDLGVKVLRFWNREVNNDIEKVLEKIKFELD